MRAGARSPLGVICPHDRASLVAEGSVHRCNQCHREYPERDGVLRLLDGNDQFYEGTYQNHVAFSPKDELPWHIWPLWLINSGYVWLVRGQVPAGAVVVELGCAGGVRYFGERYRMVGCDLSGTSLRRLRGSYEMLLQADASRCVPLESASVGAVVSSYFWEHIPSGIKPKIASECFRVLEPGGKLVFLYDVETDNPLIRRYKRRSPATYTRLFIDNDGHLGYQTPAENEALFRAAGFIVSRRCGGEKLFLQSPCVYEKLAHFEGRGKRLLRRAAGLANAPLFYPYTALLRITDTVLDPFLPTDWARIELVVCTKPA